MHSKNSKNVNTKPKMNCAKIPGFPKQATNPHLLIFDLKLYNYCLIMHYYYPLPNRQTHSVRARVCLHPLLFFTLVLAVLSLILVL